MTTRKLQKVEVNTPLGTLILYPLGELQQLDLRPERRKILVVAVS